jgi:streptogramin lyase
VSLAGGNFLLTGPATVVGTFSVSRPAPCNAFTATYQFTLDGNPVGTAFSGSGATISGSTTFSVPAGGHIIGLQVTHTNDLATECAEVISAGSVVIQALCVGSGPSPVILP